MLTGRACRAFTLVEIMVVVAIIGLLATLAVPAFMRARSESCAQICLSNLRQIDQGKEMHEFNAQLSEEDTCSWNDVLPYLKKRPECPSGGDYTLGKLGELTTCSEHDFSDT